MSSRFRAVLVVAAPPVVLLSACGGDDQRHGADVATPATTTTAKAAQADHTGMTTGMTEAPPAALPTSVTIAAKNVAFVPTSLTIAKDTDVQVTFDNQDAGVPHNIHFDTPKTVKTDVKNGAGQDTFTLNVDKAGKYHYMCDVHPTMLGTLTVR
jgi:plastocyanin